jgi:tripartite-type tricarboxylate transporter receptor subunit TctC
MLRVLASLVWGLLVVISPSDAISQQQYPNGPITLVVPFPAGGANDIVARTIARPMSKALGQAVVIDNRAGAGGQVGAMSVTRTAPDGYTLLVAQSSLFLPPAASEEGLLTNPVTSANFIAIARLAYEEMVLVSRPNLFTGSPRQLLDASRRGKRLSFASSGSRIEAALRENLVRTANLQAMSVPYKGSAVALNDVIGGQTDVAIVSMGAALQHIRSGRLIAVMTFTNRRSSFLDSVATASELGIQGCNYYLSYTLYAPRGVPPSILMRVRQSLPGISDSETNERLRSVAVRTFNPAAMPDHCANCTKSCEECGKDKECCPEQ